jgi:hypothetical protein
VSRGTLAQGAMNFRWTVSDGQADCLRPLILASLNAK